MRRCGVVERVRKWHAGCKKSENSFGEAANKVDPVFLQPMTGTDTSEPPLLFSVIKIGITGF